AGDRDAVRAERPAVDDRLFVEEFFVRFDGGGDLGGVFFLDPRREIFVGLVNQTGVGLFRIAQEFDLRLHAGALDGVFDFADRRLGGVAGGEPAVELDVRLPGHGAAARRLAVDVADGDRPVAE